MIKFSAKLTPSDQPNQALLTVQPWEVENLKQLDTEKLYVVEVKEFKSKRSLEQNKLMWELIDQVNKKLNGWKADKESELLIYTQLIEMAQIKRDYIATIEEAIPTLRQTFRVVKELGKVKLETGQELIRLALYRGTSQFNTEEMSRFIDQLLDYAEQVGIDTREYT